MKTTICFVFVLIRRHGTVGHHREKKGVVTLIVECMQLTPRVMYIFVFVYAIHAANHSRALIKVTQMFLELIFWNTSLLLMFFE